jgi:hypothetical protein
MVEIWVQTADRVGNRSTGGVRTKPCGLKAHRHNPMGERRGLSDDHDRARTLMGDLVTYASHE